MKFRKKVSWGLPAIIAVAGILFFTVNLAHAVCPEGLISYWKLEEVAGPNYADFKDGNNGVGNNSPTFNANGKVGNAQDFVATSNTGIDVDADGSFNWGKNESFSIEFWMKGVSGVTCKDAREVMVGRDDAVNPLQWWFACNAGGNVAFQLTDDNGTADNVRLEPAPEVAINDGGWHHIVGVRDATTGMAYLYVDGNEVDNDAAVFSSGFESKTGPINMGNLAGSFGFNGTLDEVAIYDKALTAAEVQQHYNGGDGGLGPRYCVDFDSDGISDGEENSGPNDGDANQDGTPDSIQNTVTTLLTYDESNYVTLELLSPVGGTLSNCQALDNPSPGDAPTDTTFPFGFFGFTIDVPVAGASAELNLIFPQGQSLDTYYKYGPQLPGAAVEWYEFLDDGTTGAAITDNEVTLRFVDNDRGDDTGPDSTIVDQGGPAESTDTSNKSSGGGGGGGGGCFIATAAY